MKLSQTHTQAKAHDANANPDPTLASPQPGMGPELAGAYFPNTRVASQAGATSFWSPGSYNGPGPGGDPNDALMVPRGGESPWIIHNPSDEQGLGRSPGQAWPWQSISERYNFDQLAIMPFEMEQTGGMPGIPGGWDGRNPPERDRGLPGRTVYYEQHEGYVTDPNSVAVTQDPQQVAYAIGWGALDDPGGYAEDYGY